MDEQPLRTQGSSRAPGMQTLTRDRARANGQRRPRRRAEPLRASWSPATRALPPGKRHQSKLKKLVATYGWRIYALPVLVVITALVIIDTVRSDPTVTPAAEASGSSGQAAAPAATESPPAKQDLRDATAELPDGGPFTAKGRGTWKVIKHRGGNGKIAGSSGRLFKYTIDVENGVDAAAFGGDDAFASTVEATLSDKRSWTGTGKLRLQRVNKPAEADFQVSLASGDTARNICGDAIPYPVSCYQAGSPNRVTINLARWVRGAKAFSGDMVAYRQYAVNHEVGHALGNHHVGCKTNGGLAPVMMQQTFGVSDDYVSKLNDTTGGDRTSVQADGKLCRPNAWPNPTAK